MFKKSLLNLGLVVVVPTVVLSSVLGVVFGTKNSNDNSAENRNPAITYGDNYFDDNIKKDWLNNLKNNIAFPQNGKNILTDYILLESSKMSRETMINMIKPNTKGEVKPLLHTKMSFTPFNSKTEIEKGFLQFNKQLVDFKAKNPNKKLAIFWDTFSKDREVIVEVFELNSNSKQEMVIDTFLNKLKTLDGFGNNLDFVSPMSSEWFLDYSSLTNELWFNKLKDYYPDFKNPQLAPGKKDPNEVLKFIPLSKFNVPLMGENAYVPVDYHIDEELGVSQYLLKNNLVASISPNINLENKTLDYNINLYELGKDSVIVVNKTSKYVKNPKNVYRRVIHRSLDPKSQVGLKNVWSAIPNGSNGGLKDGMQPIISNTKNKNLLVEKITNNWVHYATDPSQKVIQAGFSIMGEAVPSSNNMAQAMVDTLQAIKQIQDIKINNKSMKDIIFNEVPKNGGKTVVDKIIDTLNSSMGVQPTGFWNSAIKDFTGSSSDKWSQISTFINTNPYKIMDGGIPNGKPSGARDLYNIFVGWFYMSRIIKDRILELYKDGDLKTNPYNENKSNKLLISLLELLKTNKIISATTTLSDLMQNPIGILKLLLDGAKHNRSIPIEPKYFKVIFSILSPGIDDKKNSEISEIFGSFFKDRKKTIRLLKLLGGNNKTQDIMDIFNNVSNRWPELIQMISKNSKHESSFLKSLGRLLFDKGGIGNLIPMLAKTDLDLGPLIKGLIHGFSSSDEWMKALPSLDSDIKNIISVIIKNIYDLDGMVLNTLLKIEPEKIKTFVKVFKHGLRSLDVNEIKIFLVIIGTILKGDTIKIPGADGIAKIFDRLAPNPDVNDATKNIVQFLYQITR